MAITKVTEDWKGLSGSVNFPSDGKTGRLTRKFCVSFNNLDTAVKRLSMVLDDNTMSSWGVPKMWDVHPNNRWHTVVSKSAAIENGPTNFVVTVEYDYIPEMLLQQYTIQFSPQSSSEAIDKAIDSTSGTETMTLNLCNSADEPFDPPIQEEFYDISIVIKRYEEFFPFSRYAFHNRINKDTFLIKDRAGTSYSFAPKTVVCKSIQAEEVQSGIYSDGKPTWRYYVTYEFMYRPDGWSRRILDQGFREKVTGGYKTIKDSEGNGLTQPVKLDGNGTALASTADAVFIEFQTKQSVNFASLGFGTNTYNAEPALV